MPNKNISYLNKDFNTFKKNLIDYAKTYFPSSYNDFSDANPGNMFIEMASYVGDAMSFYLDTQIQENFLLYAKEKANLYALSYTLGYKPKVSYASNTIVDIYQLCPGLGTDYSPNTASYGILVPENTVLLSNKGVKFITTEKVDFTNNTNTETIYNSDTGYFLLKKSVGAISAEIKTTTINIPSVEKFTTFNISDANILQIIDITDEQGNKWYEVPYLAQNTLFDKVDNPNYNSDGVPYLLQLKRIPRRFISRFLSEDILQLEFGAGMSNKSDDTILPNPDNIKLGLVPGISNLYDDYNKASVFFTQEYGLAPSGNLTIKYLVGGGITSNTEANSITNIDKVSITIPTPNNTVIDSIIVNNPNPSSGGRSGDQIEEIRNNALNAYQSQLRAVTREDYMIRALSMPSDYGSIAKVYVTQDMAKNILSTPTVTTTEEFNPLSLDMYVLGYDSNKKLISTPITLKQNLAAYINEFRMVTDAINIKDAFYINIGVNFDITVKSGFNNNIIIINCLSTLKDYFNIEKWNINQPINESDVVSQLLQVKGVQSVAKLEIVNKQDSTGNTYSQYAYDIDGATRNGNVYPSLDPSIFEVRYPDNDIQGRVVPFTI
jgi:hypothetical protein